ncbi:LacI family DNA-binding transcriptional regulator [Asticcacaulis sp. 201]|uniref:LacI family DNA-binding transcriptional regulator n=1 Tax=Asticcacaulis sp. 201 TaxID=3028787 RepID=UPI002917038F|nr:LacI family DNA-binding transcriptional regulator [Asticcacaulis sp. 201]MDV6331411.1 LacI family DNA-binding transcriptional regulator [Asticcacaulis sp. 201]
MTAKAPTIYDVAALAGVGRTTVSRVLNGEGRVAETTKTRVLDAIHALRYKVNTQARLLAGGRVHSLMLVYPANDEVGPVTWYNLLIESGAQRGCARAGLQLQMTQIFPDSLKRHDRILEPVIQHACDGVILAPPFSDDAELIGLLKMRNFPVASIAAGPATRSLSAGVGIDDEAAGYDLTRYLLGLGHKRFAFIDGLRDHISAAQRFEGFRRALTDAGLGEADHRAFRGTLTFSTGADHMRALIDSGFPATAVICANDDMAAGALYHAHERGVRVPGDISVVGFDDAPFAQMVWPPLTTIHQPVFAMAQRAVEIILQQIRGQFRGQPQAYEMAPHRLVTRHSATSPASGARI